jgi:probable HAF family extracellular repeat protein
LNESAGTYYDTSGNGHGFYRAASGRLTFITYPGSIATTCGGINDSGVIVGTYEDSSSQWHGFLYKAGKYTEQSLLFINGINNVGTLVGAYLGPGAANGVAYGSLATPTTFASYESVQVPGAKSIATYAINDSAAMVGVYTNSSGTIHGLLYENKKVTIIDDPNAEAATTTAYGINTAGEIVGSYTNGSDGLGRLSLFARNLPGHHRSELSGDTGCGH